MYRLTTFSRNALGELYSTQWAVAFPHEAAAVRIGEGLLDDAREGFGCVIGYRVASI